MLIIKCKHDISQTVVSYIDGAICHPIKDEYGSIFKADIPIGKHKIILEQKSIFNSPYWWIALNPFYWLMNGGISLNYYLGFDARFAQIEIDVDKTKSDTDIVIDLILLKKIYHKSPESITERSYYNFTLPNSSKKIVMRGTADPKSLNMYRVKWILSQLVLPVSLFIILAFLTLYNQKKQYNFEIIVSLIVLFLLLIERISRVLLTKSKKEELEILKCKKEKQKNI